jgi:hypothetical protein
MCTHKKVIKNIEVTVDVQKRAVGFRERKMAIDVLVSSKFTFFFHCYRMVIALNDYLVHSCWAFGFQVFTNGRLLEHSWAPLSLRIWIMAKLLCYCLCLLDVIVELHAMGENLFNVCLIGK